MAENYRRRRKSLPSTTAGGRRAPKAPSKAPTRVRRPIRAIVARPRAAAATVLKNAYETAQPSALLFEPSAADLAREQTRLDEEVQQRKNTGRRAPAAGADLLASYMDQLSNIPLFTPEQEAQNARNLETLDLHAWRLVLAHPRGAQLALSESRDLEAPLPNKLGKLLQSYNRATARTHARELGPSSGRTALIEELATALRFADCDKELFAALLSRLRKDVWSRRVIDSRPAFRVTHAQLTEVERANGIATRARNNFARANLRLVISVARNFHHARVPFIDLIQEGNVGLMKAIHRFDHRRGFRFSTYAHWWIRQSIERAMINKGNQVRLPVHVIDSRRQVGRAAARLAQRLGRAPTTQEISKSMKLSVAKVEDIRSGIQNDPVSLDDTFSKDDPRSFMDLVKDETVPETDEALIRENTYVRLRELLHHLNPIEKDILRRRFGLGDDSDQTLDEIGKLYNLSRERVRQIQAASLIKMRRMCERRDISL